jgi:hypothetical protein
VHESCHCTLVSTTDEMPWHFTEIVRLHGLHYTT